MSGVYSAYNAVVGVERGKGHCAAEVSLLARRDRVLQVLLQMPLRESEVDNEHLLVVPREHEVRLFITTSYCLLL